MALAPFFDKAALAASHVLRGFDPSAFAATLEKHVVTVAFDRTACASAEGRATLQLLVNLLARLYLRISLAPLDDASTGMREQLADAARRVNPLLEISDGLDLAFVLAVGDTQLPATVSKLHLGSDGWVVAVSPDSPVGSGTSGNPFGAAAAACFGAANAFRALFADQLADGGLDTAWRMSLLDLNPTVANPVNPALDGADLGEAHLVGVGAIGNGAVWSLARVPGLRGILHLIDPETVDTTNVQRYALTALTDVGSPKVTLAHDAMNGTDLEVRPHQTSWAEYLAQRGDWRLERVMAALDSARDRCAVQSSLPRWVANAWTQTGDFGVSLHPAFDDGACLMCLYLPEGETPHEDAMVAAAIGLKGPEAQREIRSLLHSGAPIGQAWIERIAASLGVPVEPLIPFANRPLRAFYAEAVCGGIVLALGGGTEIRAEVPMAFQSALAGVLMSAHLVADAAGLQKAAPSVARVNLLRPLPNSGYLMQRKAKHPSARCICRDAAFLDRYREKYEV